MMSTKDLRWISWEQHGDAERDPDCRPLAWPPPAEVLAFWETGLGGDEGSDAYCTVVALVRAPSERAAAAIIQKAWSPGIGEWRFTANTANTARTDRRVIASPHPRGRSSWAAGPGAGLSSKFDERIVP